jgi:outer membrane protein OmpA-like peptidoglycan-associated protein
MSRAFRLGAFIVGTLLILAAGVFLIGDKEFLFSSTFPLKADFKNVAGLNVGADVRVGGLREGTIQRIELPSRPDEKVTVVMKMHDSTRNIIRKDSVASIKTEGLLGDKYVEISFGSKEAPQVQDGDAIRSVSPVDVAEVANSVAAQSKAVLTAVQEDVEALKKNFLLRGFFNKRGYEDSADLNKHAISRVPAKPHIKEFEYRASELFEQPDSAKLKNEKALEEAGTFLEQNKFGLVVVAASEVLGDSDKDRVLTQAKAMVVRDYLAQNFRLDDTRIKTIGLGKTKAMGDTSKVRILIYP